MKAIRPMRPTTKKNDVNVMFLPPVFLFRFLDEIKAEYDKQQDDSKPSEKQRVEFYSLLHDSCEDNTAKNQFGYVKAEFPSF